MRAYDKLPEAQPNKSFPIGDIVNSPLADVYISAMENEDWYEFLEYVEVTYTAKDQTWSENVVHGLTLELVQLWDHGKDGGSLALRGFKIASSFLNETNLLPRHRAELRMEVIHMKHTVDIAEFALRAWTGMAHSHPRIFAYHQSLYSFAEKEADLSTRENAERFIAGLSLPYMLAYTGSMLELAENELSDANK